MELSLPGPLASSFRCANKAQEDILKPNERLNNALANSQKHGIPDIQISPSQGQMLSILCQMISAKSILEIGALGGYSTIWFAESHPGVKVTSVEFNSKHRSVALENLQGLNNVEILLGDAAEVMPKLATEGRVFDFVFIDANWDGQKEYFENAVTLTRKGGCIYVDNVIRHLTETEAEGDPTGRMLIDHLTKDSRVEVTLIPTMSTHKKTIDALVDGFVLAIVK